MLAIWVILFQAISGMMLNVSLSKRSDQKRILSPLMLLKMEVENKGGNNNHCATVKVQDYISDGYKDEAVALANSLKNDIFKNIVKALN